MTKQPRRSVLYMPANNARALEKAQTIKADSFVFDLEDAVSEQDKVSAREQAVQAANLDVYFGREIMIRVNGIGTPWFEDDVAAIAGSGAQALVVPKIESADDIVAVRTELAKIDRADMPLFAMLETPMAFLNAGEIAQSVGPAGGLMIGTNDLEKELGISHRTDRLNIMPALQTAILAAKAYGLGVLDGVYSNFQDKDGLTAECEQGRILGFDGKTLIHPSQVDAANQAFGPSDDDLREAKAIVEAFNKATAEGKGMATVDGRMIEALHAKQAQALIDFATTLSLDQN